MTDPTRQAVIAVIEDEGTVREAIVDLVASAGFRAAAFGSANDFEAGRLQPDLVILDLQLPGQDGLGFAAKLRATSRIPIIMLTGAVTRSTGWSAWRSVPTTTS